MANRSFNSSSRSRAAASRSFGNRIPLCQPTDIGRTLSTFSSFSNQLEAILNTSVAQAAAITALVLATAGIIFFNTPCTSRDVLRIITIEGNIYPEGSFLRPLDNLHVLDAVFRQPGCVGDGAKWIIHLRWKQIQGAVDARRHAG
uniref:Uncharacterized protein n=1 Tax=Anopheles coluzzii TaxID=1518534 RepID=A0A8W7PPW0_ANOCL